MHYYQKNLGDYYKKAGRLSMLQHGAYTLLIDACYDRERFPTMGEAIEWSWASTTEEIEAVKFVLAKFFHLSDDNYVQSRVETELEKYKITGLINQLTAFSREARKKKRDLFAVACDELRGNIKHDPLSKMHAAWSSVIEALVKQHETAPNQEPITNNQEPITNLKEGGDDKPSPRPATKKTQLKTYLKNCEEIGVDPIPEDSIVFRNADTLQLPYEFVLVGWEHFKNHWLSKTAAKVDWVATFNNCLKADGYGAYQRNSTKRD